MIYTIKEFLEKKGFIHKISKSTFSKNVIHIFYLDDNKWECYLSIDNNIHYMNIRLEFFKSDEDYVNDEKYYYEIITDYKIVNSFSCCRFFFLTQVLFCFLDLS